MAIRYEQALRGFYQSFAARGKAAKETIVAARRRLLVILNAPVHGALPEQPQVE